MREHGGHHHVTWISLHIRVRVQWHDDDVLSTMNYYWWIEVIWGNGLLNPTNLLIPLVV